MKFLLHIFCYIPEFLLRSLRINMSTLSHKFVYTNWKVTQAYLYLSTFRMTKIKTAGRLLPTHSHQLNRQIKTKFINIMWALYTSSQN